MLKRRLSVFFLLASYVFLFFFLWAFADFNFAPIHNRYYFPLDIAVHWDTWDLRGWLSYFFKTIGSYLFGGLHLFYAIRQIISSHRERDYLSLGANNLIFSFLLGLALFLSFGLHYVIIVEIVNFIPRLAGTLTRSYVFAILPIIAYAFCLKFWLFRQSKILSWGEKAKRKNDSDSE
jgi:hypothetical protein